VYWNFFGGGDGVRMVQMQNDFAKAHPEINLKATTIAWGVPFYTKLTTSTVVGKGPDVASLHMTRLPTGLFSSGKAAFHWNGDWEATTFATAKLPYDMTLFPNVFGSNATQADSHSLVIPHQKSMDPAKLDAILKFIGFVLKDSLVWAEGGHIPAYLPVATSSAYKNLVPESHYAAEAQYVTYDPNAWWSGSGSQFETDAGGYFQAAMQLTASPAAVLSQFKTNLQKYINTPQPG
jgi:multiple sugar transport system substrate-binding protein